MQDTQGIVATGAESEGVMGRVVRAMLLDSDLYSQARHLPGEALVIVLVTAILSAVPGMLRLHGFLSWAVAIVIFFFWSLLTFTVGKRLGGEATYTQIIGPLGYAYTPHILGVFSIIPVLGGIAKIVGMVWAFAASVIAIRQAMELDDTKAIVTALISGAILLAIAFFLVAILGIGLLSFGTLLNAYN